VTVLKLYEAAETRRTSIKKIIGRRAAAEPVI
jgi:hypothetical protein